MGKVIVRFEVNKRNGSYNASIKGHEDGASCSDGVDEDILEDLLNTNVPGFGDLTYTKDSGKTDEFFEEKQTKHRPHHYTYESDNDASKNNFQKEKMGSGFGV